jgi:hypothetical protein
VNRGLLRSALRGAIRNALAKTKANRKRATRKPRRSGLVQKQVPYRRRISNKQTLTRTLSRPTGEGTA